MSRWLSFMITPVQGFVEAARTVRDLRVGSDILCLLATRAYEAALGIGAPSPVLPARLDRRHMPNTFILEYRDEAQATCAATKACNAARDAWIKLANGVRTALSVEDGEWDRQIASYFDIRTLVIPLDGCDNAGARWERASIALAATKLVRHYPGDQGTGRQKCSILGDLEHVEHGDPPPHDGIHIRKGERLCAVSLTKRFAPVSSGADSVLRKLKGRVRDTGGIATAAWASSLCRSSAWTRYCKAVEPYDDDPVSRLLLEGQKQLQDEAEERGKELPTGLIPARAALLNAVRDEHGPPPRYYAIVCLDGDELGKWLRREKGTNRPEHGFEVWVSKQLLAYCGAVGGIVHQHHGYLAYAGGDDVLALLPLAGVLTAAAELRRAFPDFSDGVEGGASTASIGIAVLHYKSDLQAGLRCARRMLHQAKNDGRDRLGIAVLKRSGGEASCTASWAALGCVEKLRGFYRLTPKPMSDRWLGRFSQVAGTLSAAGTAPALIANQVRYFAERAEGPDATTIAAFAQAVSDLSDEVAKCTQDAIQHRGHGSNAEERIEALITLAGLASFLDRGVDAHG